MLLESNAIPTLLLLGKVSFESAEENTSLRPFSERTIGSEDIVGGLSKLVALYADGR